VKVLSSLSEQVSEQLVVGGGPDDSGVYQIDEDRYMVQSVDFFTPIVDDPADYGAIAAANSLSDLYAMAARPATALNVVAVPYDEVGEDRLMEILNGEAEKVREAGSVIVGGHTVKNPEPVVGLAVTGFVQSERLVRNRESDPGDRLFLTKPLGTGIVTTAFQNGNVNEEILGETTRSMKTLNDVGIRLAEEELVSSMTDITGYGLIGHAREMIPEDLGVSVSLEALPVFEGVRNLVDEGFVPGGTRDNWSAFEDWVDREVEDEFGKWIVSDAQTSGGLLLSVPPENEETVRDLLDEHSRYAKPIGAVNEEEGFRLTR
jgi:selenide,water dikinase